MIHATKIKLLTLARYVKSRFISRTPGPHETIRLNLPVIWTEADTCFSHHFGFEILC